MENIKIIDADTLGAVTGFGYNVSRMIIGILNNCGLCIVEKKYVDVIQRCEDDGK